MAASIFNYSRMSHRASPRHTFNVEVEPVLRIRAIEESVSAKLPDGTKIRLITAPYFIATKLEAFFDRGGGDYMSHDIEDILSVIDGRPEISQEISQQRGTVAAYLRAEIDALISDESFLQSLPAHFLPNQFEQQRVPLLLGRLREIARL
jgi:hypothetical protein